MITYIEGPVAHVADEQLVVNVGGIGYKVFATPSTLSQAEKEEHVALWTHLAVRENALDLYGFISRDELLFFELLIGVSGVGPKSALSILALADTVTLKSAIAQGDTSYLTKVSGIGAKNAQKIVLELNDKIGTVAADGALQDDADAIDALAAMGYSIAEAREALKKVPQDAQGAQRRLKEALKQLAR